MTTAAYRNAQDKAFCLQQFNICLQCGVSDEDLVKVFRLGKKQEGGNQRLLMVQLASYSTKCDNGIVVQTKTRTGEI